MAHEFLELKNVSHALWHPSGQYVAVVQDLKHIMEIHAQTGEILTQWDTSGVVAHLSYNTLGKFLTAACVGGKVMCRASALYESSLNSRSGVVDTHYDGMLYSAHLNPEGTQVVLIDENRCTEIWSTHSERIHRLPFCIYASQQAYFSSCGDKVIVLGKKDVWMFNAVSGELMQHISLLSEAMLSYQSQENAVLVTANEQQVQMLRLGYIPEKKVLFESKEPLKNIYVCPTEYVLQFPERVAVWDKTSLLEKQSYSLRGLTHVSVSPTGKLLMLNSEGICLANMV